MIEAALLVSAADNVIDFGTVGRLEKLSKRNYLNIFPYVIWEMQDGAISQKG